MFSNRIYIDNNGNKQPLIDLEQAERNLKEGENGIFLLKANNGDNYAIKIIFQKLKTIGKQSVIMEFIKEYPKHKKIIVATDFNNKILEFAVKNHSQLFRESSLMSDLISHDEQPKFELLSPTEMELVKKEYNINEYTSLRLQRSDPITKYFALKKGDIIKIIRPSPISGSSIVYRMVV
jgi:DNA-directed RNA polymerase subunit H (RpoH/RPB5)